MKRYNYNFCTISNSTFCEKDIKIYILHNLFKNFVDTAVKCIVI